MTEKNILVKVPITPPTSGGTGGFTPGGPLEIGPIIITAGKIPKFSMHGMGGGYDSDNSLRAHNEKWTQLLGFDPENRPGGARWVGMVRGPLGAQESKIKRQYEAVLKNQETLLKEEIEELKASNPNSGNTSVEKLTHELSLHNALIAQKSADLQEQIKASEVFYGSNPIGKTPIDFAKGMYRLRSQGVTADDDIIYERHKSLTAAYEAKLLETAIAALTAKAAGVKSVLDATTAAQQARVAAEAIAKVAAEAAAVVEAKRAADEQAKYEDAIKATASFYEEVAGKFGKKASTLAQELAESAKGKSIRSADEAFKAFDKYKGILDKKFSAKDWDAAAKQIDSMDFDAVGKAAARFGKGFGYVGKAMDVKDVYLEVSKAMRSGDWKPAFVKLETIGLGLAATAMVGVVFGFAAVTPLGILGFGALMALTGAVINDTTVEMMNKYFSTI